VLREYAVTPQVLLREAYADPDLYRLALRQLRDEIGELGLVRNMSDGDWGVFLEGAFKAADSPGKELLKFAAMRRRLVRRPKDQNCVPITEIEWESAALSEHQRQKTTGIVVTPSGKARHRDKPIVANILSLSDHVWWDQRKLSSSVRRRWDDVRRAWEPIFRHSSTLMFIDPHIDPDKPRYGDFPRMLEYIAKINPTCVISVHRISPSPLRQAAAQTWACSFKRWAENSKKKFTLFVRGKDEVFRDRDIPLHDRFLISDLAPFSLTNGFDFDGESMTMSLVDPSLRQKTTDFFDKKYGPGVYSAEVEP